MEQGAVATDNDGQIAVRAHVPIMVDQSVMESAGIVPEEDLQEQDEQVSPYPDGEVPEVEDPEARLSIFEDFLDGLDLDEPDTEEDKE